MDGSYEDIFAARVQFRNWWLFQFLFLSTQVVIAEKGVSLVQSSVESRSQSLPQSRTWRTRRQRKQQQVRFEM